MKCASQHRSFAWNRFAGLWLALCTGLEVSRFSSSPIPFVTRNTPKEEKETKNPDGSHSPPSEKNRRTSFLASRRVPPPSATVCSTTQHIPHICADSPDNPNDKARTAAPCHPTSLYPESDTTLYFSFQSQTTYSKSEYRRCTVQLLLSVDSTRTKNTSPDPDSGWWCPITIAEATESTFSRGSISPAR